MNPEIFSGPTTCDGKHEEIQSLHVYTGNYYYESLHDAAFFPLTKEKIRQILVTYAIDHPIITYEIEYGDGCKKYDEFQPTEDEFAVIVEGRFAKKR